MQTESLDDTTDHGTTEEENDEIGGSQSDENDESNEKQLVENGENSEEHLDENGESMADQPEENGENSEEPSPERPAGPKRKKPTGRPLGSPNTKTTLKMSNITQLIGFLETVLLRMDMLTKKVRTLDVRLGIPTKFGESLVGVLRSIGREHTKEIAKTNAELAEIKATLSAIQSKLETLWE